MKIIYISDKLTDKLTFILKFKEKMPIKLTFACDVVNPIDVCV